MTKMFGEVATTGFFYLEMARNWRDLFNDYNWWDLDLKVCPLNVVKGQLQNPIVKLRLEDQIGHVERSWKRNFFHIHLTTELWLGRFLDHHRHPAIWKTSRPDDLPENPRRRSCLELKQPLHITAPFLDVMNFLSCKLCKTRVCGSAPPNVAKTCNKITKPRVFWGCDIVNAQFQRLEIGLDIHILWLQAVPWCSQKSVRSTSSWILLNFFTRSNSKSSTINIEKQKTTRKKSQQNIHIIKIMNSNSFQKPFSTKSTTETLTILGPCPPSVPPIPPGWWILAEKNREKPTTSVLTEN